jgi:hypothetical protein
MHKKLKLSSDSGDCGSKKYNGISKGGSLTKSAFGWRVEFGIRQSVFCWFVWQEYTLNHHCLMAVILVSFNNGVWPSQNGRRACLRRDNAARNYVTGQHKHVSFPSTLIGHTLSKKR